MTPDQFDKALSELGWKGSDFCARAGLVPNTVWRWRKALAPIPEWADEYLRAMLAIQRLHVEFVAVASRGKVAPAPGADESAAGVVEVGATGGMSEA